MKKHKLLLLLFSGIMALTLSGCEEYNENAESAVMEFEESASERYAAEIAGKTKGSDGSSAEELSESGNTEQESSESGNTEQEMTEEEIQADRMARLASLDYSDKPATQINKDVPYFTDEEIAFARNLAANNGLLDNKAVFARFSSQDGLKRTGQAYALLNQSMAPGDDVTRGDISSIRPTGWVQEQYSWIDNGGWLYNRCHLIAWSLTGEDANEKNLMTGTRYFNTEGMLPYEIKVLKYLNEYPDNHVMYRATPIYSGSELLARGLLLEAYSIEDEGELSFCAYIHNVQPGVDIDYATGSSRMNEYMEILKKGE